MLNLLNLLNHGFNVFVLLESDVKILLEKYVGLACGNLFNFLCANF